MKTIQELLRTAFTIQAQLKILMTIRALVVKTSENDLVLLDEFFGRQMGLSPEQQKGAEDIRTFIRLLMFFRSEVSSRCMDADQLKSLWQEIAARGTKP